MVEIIDGDAPPLVQHVATPKVADVQLRYGQMLAFPLRAPRRHSMEISSSYEGGRFLVVAIEPDERKELDWTTKIKPGDVVTVSNGPHMVGMRVDVGDCELELGPYSKGKDDKGRCIQDILVLDVGHVLAWATQEVTEREFDGVTDMLDFLRRQQMAEMKMMMELNQ